MKRLGVGWLVRVDFLPPLYCLRFCVPFSGLERFYALFPQLSVAKIGFFSFIVCFNMRYYLCLHVSKICLRILCKFEFKTASSYQHWKTNVFLSGNRPLAWYPLLLERSQYIFLCQRNKTDYLLSEQYSKVVVIFLKQVTFISVIILLLLTEMVSLRGVNKVQATPTK